MPFVIIVLSFSPNKPQIGQILQCWAVRKQQEIRRKSTRDNKSHRKWNCSTLKAHNWGAERFPDCDSQARVLEIYVSVKECRQRPFSTFSGSVIAVDHSIRLPESRPGVSYVFLLSGVSRLSFVSTLLSPFLFFCWVLLLFLSYLFSACWLILLTSVLVVKNKR